MFDVEIICFGNELLIGKTVNTNANWLGKRIISLGGNVTRITTVGDNIDEMSHVLQEALSRKPKVIITTGGMGPTFDDVALQAVAIATKKQLEVNEEAIELIKNRIKDVKEARGIELELSEERKQMAKLPEGALPLRNRAGTAPGVLVNIDDTIIFSVPGVPKEMIAIFDFEMVQYLTFNSKEKFYNRRLVVNYVPESELAVAISPIRENHPSVYIKTHPHSYTVSNERIIEVEIHITMVNTEEESKILDQVVERIIETIKQLKGAKGEKPKIRIVNDDN